MFHVGQLVVCVDDEEGRFVLPGIKYTEWLHGLIKGKVYTIRWVGICKYHIHHCVRLAEIIRPIRARVNGGEEGYFAAARFRPVVETRLDVFREMLAPVPNVKQKECVP